MSTGVAPELALKSHGKLEACEIIHLAVEWLQEPPDHMLSELRKYISKTRALPLHMSTHSKEFAAKEALIHLTGHQCVDIDDLDGKEYTGACEDELQPGELLWMIVTCWH